MTSNYSMEGMGLEELRLIAEQGADGTRVLEQCFRLIFEASPRFSHRQWGTILRRSLDRADRYRPGCCRTGAGVSWVIDRMQDDRATGWQPYSLAYYAGQLGKESAKWRREAKAAKRTPPAGTPEALAA